MSLQTCDECGKEVSSSASKCPHCGATVISKGCATGCLIVFLICFAMGGISYFTQDEKNQKIKTDENAWKKENNSIEAYLYAQDFVKMRLKSPASADFPPYIENSVKYYGDQVYMVKSYVDSQNSFGAMIRSHYICEIRQVDIFKWRLISFKFIQ